MTRTAASAPTTRRNRPTLSGALLSAGLAAALLAGALPAQAAEIAPLKIGNWKGGAYSSDQTGRFSHCAASAKYRSGIALLFSVSNDRSWSMGFSSPEWQLNPGASYPVQYRIDNGPVLNGVARAKNPKLAQIMLPADERLFKAFRYGGTLRVAAAKKVLEFRLTDTSKLLRALLGCSQRFAGFGDGGSDPFAQSGGGDPFTSAPRQASAPAGGPSTAHRQEGHELSSLLLSKAGMRFEFLTPDDNPTLWARNAASFRMPGMVGSIRVFDDPSLSSAALKTGIVSGDSQSCKGRFASASVSVDRPAFRDFLVACVSGGRDDMAIYYVLLDRRAGGHYLLSLAGPASEAARIKAAGLAITQTAIAGADGGSAGRGLAASYTR